MDIKEIRARNYFELRKKFRQKEASEGIEERGETGRLSNMSGISAQYLSHITNGRKAIGHATARKLEDAFGKKHGWMDVDHLSGAVPMDTMGREFGELAMRLYIKDPEGLRSLLMEYMERKMNNETV